MIWFAVAYLLERVQLKIGAFSYGVEFNGIGAIDAVADGTAKAPMAYRVLVPVLVRWLEQMFPRLKAHRLTALYEPLKILLTGAALWAISAGMGTESALFCAAALPATFLYDYWDWTGELGGLAMALGGDLFAAGLGGVWAGLSRRETALLVSVTYWLRTHDWAGTAWVALSTGIAILAVQLIVGPRQPYANNRWTGRVLRTNLRDLRSIRRNRPWYLGEISMSVAISLLTLIVVVTGRAGPTWPVPLALVAAGWTMARAAETRVFTSCLLWISLIL